MTTATQNLAHDHDLLPTASAGMLRLPTPPSLDADSLEQFLYAKDAATAVAVQLAKTEHQLKQLEHLQRLLKSGVGSKKSSPTQSYRGLPLFINHDQDSTHQHPDEGYDYGPNGGGEQKRGFFSAMLHAAISPTNSPTNAEHEQSPTNAEAAARAASAWKPLDPPDNSDKRLRHSDKPPISDEVAASLASTCKDSVLGGRPDQFSSGRRSKDFPALVDERLRENSPEDRRRWQREHEERVERVLEREVLELDFGGFWKGAGFVV